MLLHSKTHEVILGITGHKLGAGHRLNNIDISSSAAKIQSSPSGS